MTKTKKTMAADVKVGEFLERIGYAGPVTTKVIDRYRAFATHAGEPGRFRHRVAVELATAAVAEGEPPPVPELYAELDRRAPRASRDEVIAFLHECQLTGRVDDPELDDLVEAYAPLVAAAGRAGQPRYRIARNLVTQAPRGIVPTAADVWRTWEQAKAAKRARRAATAAEAAATARSDGIAAAARAYVAQVRADTGAGPTWRELGRSLGLSNRLMSDAVETLVNDGVLVSTTEHRSLDIPPSNAEEA